MKLQFLQLNILYNNLYLYKLKSDKENLKKQPFNGNKEKCLRRKPEEVGI